MEAIDWLRAFNALLAAFCFVLLVARLLLVWPKLADGQRLLFSAFGVFMVTTVWGSVGQVLSHAPVSYRSILLTVGLMLFLAYLVEPRSRYRGRLGRNPLNGDNFRN